MDNRLPKNEAQELVENITKTYADTGINFIDAANLPVRDKIIDILNLLMELLYPGYTGKRVVTQSNIEFVVGELVCTIFAELSDQIERACKYRCRMEHCDTGDCSRTSLEISKHLISRIPDIREMLKGDVQAAYDGDPAAQSNEEIVLSYPGLIAIATHRIAHELYLKDVPIIPRIMSEHSHSRTGIDIHPGARIGRNFFIDHGTGVVIGETCVIGDNVKIYQGTTLGALSFRKDERGRIIKGGKRHPTIEDNVTIYAEATILGDVVIGKSSIIGGNVWIKESVPEGTTILSPGPELIYKTRNNKSDTGNR